MDIEGAGENVTVITRSVNTAVPFSGTVNGSNNAELRSLTVNNSGTEYTAIAILNSLGSPKLRNVTAKASGTNICVGVSNYNASAVTMTDVTVIVTGTGATNFGIENSYSSTIMTRVDASVTGATTKNIAVSNFASSPAMKDVTAIAVGSTPTNYGIFNNSVDDMAMSGVTAIARDGSVNCGMYNLAGAASLQIDHSTFEGTACSIGGPGSFVIKVGASKLAGGTSGSTFTCAASYNSDYILLDPYCQ